MGKQTDYPYKELLWDNKRNELLIHVTSWMNIKIAVLGKRIRAQKSMPFL